jgi:hypothetical protein
MRRPALGDTPLSDDGLRLPRESRTSLLWAMRWPKECVSALGANSPSIARPGTVIFDPFRTLGGTSSGVAAVDFNVNTLGPRQHRTPSIPRRLRLKDNTARAPHSREYRRECGHARNNGDLRRSWRSVGGATALCAPNAPIQTRREKRRPRARGIKSLKVVTKNEIPYRRMGLAGQHQIRSRPCCS